MDENKLNELFRELLEVKLTAAPPSSYSSSELSTNESSLDQETIIDYTDVLKKLQTLLNSTLDIDTFINKIITINESGSNVNFF